MNGQTPISYTFLPCQRDYMTRIQECEEQQTQLLSATYQHNAVHHRAIFTNVVPRPDRSNSACASVKYLPNPSNSTIFKDPRLFIHPRNNRRSASTSFCALRSAFSGCSLHNAGQKPILRTSRDGDMKGCPGPKRRNRTQQRLHPQR